MTLFEIIGLIVFISFQLLLIYLISFSRKKAESHFNKSLEKYKSDLIVEVGKKFIEQKGNIDKEITNLRGDIEKEINHLQSDLSLITGQKMTYLNHRREAIVEYYSNYVHWLNTILDIDLNNIKEHNLELGNLYIRRIGDAKLRYEISEGKLELYFNNDEFIKLKNKLNNETLLMQHNKEDYISRPKLNIEDRSNARKGSFYTVRALNGELVQKYNDKQLQLHKSSRIIQLKIRDKLSKELVEITNEIDKNIYSTNSQSST